MEPTHSLKKSSAYSIFSNSQTKLTANATLGACSGLTETFFLRFVHDKYLNSVNQAVYVRFIVSLSIDAIK